MRIRFGLRKLLLLLFLLAVPLAIYHHCCHDEHFGMRPGKSIAGPRPQGICNLGSGDDNFGEYRKYIRGPKLAAPCLDDLVY